ncbi:hypothetical protein GGR57DRAFT_44570 [Xylariaceae sp. FL1272]|nr:hypothetical protein GGR57DRAFT_44570 [Xylariaceae sp. FL1272]
MSVAETGRDYIKYEELGNSGQIPSSGTRSFISRPTVVAILAAASILLTIVANAGVWLLVTRKPRDALNEEWNHCGRSSSEAIERGCVMEPLFYGWMPSQCVYEDLSNRYPVFDDRKWFLEPEFVNEVPSEALWKGEHIKVYTHIYHNEHCLFQWRKVMFAIDNQLPYIDNKTISLHHTSHCADQLIAMGREGEHAVNEVELGFYQCRSTLWAKRCQP